MLRLDDMISDIEYTLGVLKAYRNITVAGKCCNTCGKIKDCEYRPEWGDLTRINCPLWVQEGEMT